MKIKSIRVEGLLGRNGDLTANFNDDLNIITGRNGAGKTTFLKLCWYLISGSISQALSEINFKSVHIVTNKFELTINKVNSQTCTAEFTDSNGKVYSFEDEFISTDRDEILIDARDQISEEITPLASSLFFPTFRRIEGGYSMSSSKRPRIAGQNREARDLEEAMANLARRMSTANNTFISSISTVDIEALLLKSYAELSESYNDLQKDVTGKIIDQIRGFEERSASSAEDDIQDARTLINEVRKKIEKMESDRDLIMNPISAIQAVVSRLFQHSGIQFSGNLSIGAAASAVKSDVLSAGEKQMLSFICYNALRSNCITFIDEPELSLHVDWQRNLFPILLEQNPTNQFIIATHSPFIYSKFPDKEICIDLSDSRGDENYGGES